MPEAERLMELSYNWNHTADPQERSDIWMEMLDIHAQNQFAIGILSEAPQPVVVSDRLRNVPETANWAWDPGAHFGGYRPDTFWFDEKRS